MKPSKKSERADARQLASQLGLEEEAARARIRRAKAMGLKWHESERLRRSAVCAVCGQNPRGKLVMDHSHAHQEYRGFLCNSCNIGLGLFHDNPEALRRAAAYLESNVRVKIMY